MSDERGSRLERLLEQTARRVSGGALHPLELLERVQGAHQAGVRDGVAPNTLTVRLNPSDYEAFRRSFRALEAEISGLLDGIEARNGWTRLGARELSFAEDPGVPPGAPGIDARFADRRLAAPAPPEGATRRITRQRGLALVLADGGKVRLTHTPFMIGRGPGNDLVIPSLSISRRHALIDTKDGELVMRDQGSRNGIVIDGARYEAVLLVPGVRIVLGDVELTLEEEA